jgi:cytochrome c oxidase subunit II
MSQPIPPSATDWWTLFGLFFYVGLIVGAIVVGAMVYYALRNRSRKGAKEFIPDIGLEKTRAREAVIFAAISAVLLFGLAIGSYRLTTDFQNPPPSEQSLTIDVTAFQWNFNFRYPNGVSTIAECRVPAGKDVIFNVTSSDVMHNFGLPDFKLKIDAIPGMYNVVWMTMPSVSGGEELNYSIRCYELCGTGHTYMIGTLIVMEPAAFDQWLGIQTPSNSTAPTNMQGMGG